MINFQLFDSGALDKAGVCFVFYDRHVDDWYTYQQTAFPTYGFKATFGVGNLSNSLDASEITKLTEMQDDGCEISSHGWTNQGTDNFFSESDVNDYINNFAGNSIDYLTGLGFNSTTYFPTGRMSGLPQEAKDLLRSNYNVQMINFPSGGNIDNLEYMVCFGMRPDETYAYPGIDQRREILDLSLDYMKSLMDYAKLNNTVVYIGGHNITAITTGTWYTLPSDLNELCAYANSINLPFKTFQETAGLFNKPFELRPFFGNIYATTENGTRLKPTDWTNGTSLIIDYDYFHPYQAYGKGGESVSWQWYLSDTGGGDEGTPIVGATSSRYTLSEVGKFIRFQGVITDNQGRQSAVHKTPWREILA